MDSSPLFARERLYRGQQDRQKRKFVESLKEEVPTNSWHIPLECSEFLPHIPSVSPAVWAR